MTVPGTPADRLAHVRWLGGGSGAGKSTVSRRLAADLGLRHYDTDAAMADHVGRLGPTEAPLLHRFLRMTMDERWVDRSPAEMLATFHWFAGEGFGCIVDDLLALPADRPVVVDGFRLLPHLVAPLLAEPAQALWLLPTPAFRESAFARRGSTWEIPGRTSDPERALRNLLERDGLFTDQLAVDVASLGLASLTVDGSQTEDELVAAVRQAFDL